MNWSCESIPALDTKYFWAYIVAYWMGHSDSVWSLAAVYCFTDAYTPRLGVGGEKANVSSWLYNE